MLGSPPAISRGAYRFKRGGVAVRRILLTGLIAVVISCVFGSLAAAQRPPLHHFHSADLPPGTVGHGQLLRFPHLRGCTQPVQILLPKGARCSLHVEGQFESPRKGPILAGMQIGAVYTLKITSISLYEGAEVFPSIEVINRIYPPSGRELHFPVPVQITQEELELALTGRFVTRVIYLEDPQAALAHRDERQHQRYFDAGPNEDPLRTADKLGRPIAILRMGSRVPDLAVTSQPGHGPPVIIYDQPELQPTGSGASVSLTDRVPRRTDRAVRRPTYRRIR